MTKNLELLDGIEPIIVEDTTTKTGDNVLRPITDNERELMGSINFANNLPACGGPIYSNTYWLPEDVETLLDDLEEKILGS